MFKLLDFFKFLTLGSGLPRPLNFLYQACVFIVIGLTVLIKPDFPNIELPDNIAQYIPSDFYDLLPIDLKPTKTAPSTSAKPSFDSAPHRLTSFSTAKKHAWEIYADSSQPGGNKDFYCRCNIDKNRLDLTSCNYSVRRNQTRAQRVEWEHIVPAWTIGHQRQCWQQGGRKNCTTNDPIYSQAEADLHNLVPVVGEVNGDRSNFAFGMLTTPPHQYGQCPMVIDFKAKTAMPPEYTRGAIARTYLYMAETYRLKLSKNDRRIYEAWNKQHPVTDWEHWRNQKNFCVQGNANSYVGSVDAKGC